MKPYIFLLCTVLLVGCDGKTNKSTADGKTAPFESINKDNSCPALRERDSIRFSYIEPVKNYRVTGTLYGYFDSDELASMELTFHQYHRHHPRRITDKKFVISNGLVRWKHFLGTDSVPTAPVRLHYPTNNKPGLITAPYNVPFFFADIDFDGAKELIAGNSEFAGTQRDVGRFTRIYKIVHGQPCDVTADFAAKSPIFDRMDEYYFSVYSARRELIYWHDGGAINFGWEVYKFENGSYRYDRYVSCFNPHGDSVRVNILTPQRDTIESFTVDKETFDREIY